VHVEHSVVQALASANHNFYLTETRRGYLRYLGALTYFEVRAVTHLLALKDCPLEQYFLEAARSSSAFHAAFLHCTGAAHALNI